MGCHYLLCASVIIKKRADVKGQGKKHGKAFLSRWHLSVSIIKGMFQYFGSKPGGIWLPGVALELPDIFK